MGGRGNPKDEKFVRPSQRKEVRGPPLPQGGRGNLPTGPPKTNRCVLGILLLKKQRARTSGTVRKARRVRHAKRENPPEAKPGGEEQLNNTTELGHKAHPAQRGCTTFPPVPSGTCIQPSLGPPPVIGFVTTLAERELARFGRSGGPAEAAPHPAQRGAAPEDETPLGGLGGRAGTAGGSEKTPLGRARGGEQLNNTTELRS